MKTQENSPTSKVPEHIEEHSKSPLTQNRANDSHGICKREQRLPSYAQVSARTDAMDSAIAAVRTKLEAVTKDQMKSAPLR